MTRGYHYTTLLNYRSIEINGLLPVPFKDKDTFTESEDTSGIWLFREPQKNEQLFGVLVDIFARHKQTWKLVELEIDFEIKDCLRAISEEDTLKITYAASVGDWAYHKDTSIIVVRESIPLSQIRLRRKFNLYPEEKQ